MCLHATWEGSRKGLVIDPKTYRFFIVCALRFSEECLSTLQFANRCRSVHNNPRVNKLGDGPAGDQRKLKKLQDEIQALRQGGLVCWGDKGGEGRGEGRVAREGDGGELA